MPAVRTTKRICVLKLDTSATVLGAISSFLNTQSRIMVIDASRNDVELLDKVKVSQPDLVVVNISTTNLDGIECVDQLRAELPKARIIVFTAYDHLMTRIMFLQAGADSVIREEQLPERVIAEILKPFPESFPEFRRHKNLGEKENHPIAVYVFSNRRLISITFQELLDPTAPAKDAVRSSISLWGKPQLLPFARMITRTDLNSKRRRLLSAKAC